MTQNPSATTQSDLFRDITIGFIGSGIMGEAIIASLLNQNIVAPNQVFAADPNQKRTETLKAVYGIRTTHLNLDVTKVADILILSIKPQMLDKVLHELHGHTDHAQVVLSIIAGAPIEHLSDGLANARIVRAMPNTPARIGQGMTVWMATPEVPEQGRERVAAILAALGQELHVDGEQYLDMATALSGSGPAYVFLFMEAMIDAGVHLGFTRAVAERLVIQTMRGSVEYAAASSEHPAVLRNQVTSPGGTTAEALYHLEQSGLRATVARAVWASFQRSQALGGTSGSNSGPNDPANKH